MREIGSCNEGVTLQIDENLGSAVVEVPVQFLNDWKT